MLFCLKLIIQYRSSACATYSDDKKLSSEAEGSIRVGGGTLELAGIHGELCFHKTSKEEWKEWLRRNGASDIY